MVISESNHKSFIFTEIRRELLIAIPVLPGWECGTWNCHRERENKIKKKEIDANGDIKKKKVNDRPVIETEIY